MGHQTGRSDFDKMVKSGGSTLTFISYPDAISKFGGEWGPQFFAILFFMMFFTLGIGSNIACASVIVTAITDNFKKVKTWQAASGISIVGFFISLMYLTPGGQFMIDLIDHFGGTFIIIILAAFEIVTISWIYGTERLCEDTNFMLNFRPGIYWRLCWKYVTPTLMFSVLTFYLVTLEPVKHNGVEYPGTFYALGWSIAALGILQVPIWMGYAVLKQKGDNWKEKFFGAFRPLPSWGPKD